MKTARPEYPADRRLMSCRARFQISMWRVQVAVRVEGPSRGAPEVGAPGDAVSVPLLQETLHHAVHVHPPHQDRASGGAREMKTAVRAIPLTPIMDRSKFVSRYVPRAIHESVRVSCIVHVYRAFVAGSAEA